MRYRILFPLCAAALVLSSCSRLVTRTETDKYIITIRDTTNREDVHNAPGVSDNGILFPTSIEQHSHREITQYDSSSSRYYPAFLRYGVFESASFFTSGDIAYGSGAGLFGIFGFFDTTFTKKNQATTFAGGMYRFLPWEDELKIKGIDDLTIGLAGLEVIAKDFRPGDALIGISPIYVRKRFFLRSNIPYVMIVPFVGVALFPSVYLNVGATCDLGSYGGMNLRAYAGYAKGSNPPYAFSKGGGDLLSNPGTVSFPYAGLGISVLDFVNRPEETKQEWKFHNHSSTEVSAFQIMAIISTDPGAKLITESFLSNFDGMCIRLATVSYPLGETLEHGFNVGTSLINILLLSGSGGGFSVLPLRAGYRMYIDPAHYVSAEPFAEVNYYPSTFFNTGGRFNVGPFSGINLNLWAGYAAGSYPGNGWPVFPKNSFSAFYAGVGVATGMYLFSGDPLKADD